MIAFSFDERFPEFQNKMSTTKEQRKMYYEKNREKYKMYYEKNREKYTEYQKNLRAKTKAAMELVNTIAKTGSIPNPTDAIEAAKNVVVMPLYVPMKKTIKVVRPNPVIKDECSKITETDKAITDAVSDALVASEHLKVIEDEWEKRKTHLAMAAESVKKAESVLADTIANELKAQEMLKEAQRQCANASANLNEAATIHQTFQQELAKFEVHVEQVSMEAQDTAITLEELKKSVAAVKNPIAPDYLYQMNRACQYPLSWVDMNIELVKQYVESIRAKYNKENPNLTFKISNSHDFYRNVIQNVYKRGGFNGINIVDIPEDVSAINEPMKSNKRWALLNREKLSELNKEFVKSYKERYPEKYAESMKKGAAKQRVKVKENAELAKKYKEMMAAQAAQNANK